MRKLFVLLAALTFCVFGHAWANGVEKLVSRAQIQFDGSQEKLELSKRRPGVAIVAWLDEKGNPIEDRRIYNMIHDKDAAKVHYKIVDRKKYMAYRAKLRGRRGFWTGAPAASMLIAIISIAASINPLVLLGLIPIGMVAGWLIGRAWGRELGKNKPEEFISPNREPKP